MVSTAEMKTIIPKLNWDKAETYVPFMTSVLPNFEINTPLRKAHFLAQVSHESGGLKFATENLNYSAEALRKVFGKYFKTAEQANQYARNPEKIANRVYADRMGNGNEASGDGWKYKGRGLIQLTGKDNYKNFSKDHNVDCVNNPDLLLNPETAFSAACWFWKRNKINKYADLDDIHMVTQRVNGGNNGILDRQQWLDSFKKLYNVIEADS